MTAHRILVTGGAGFIGSAVVSRLADAGHSVTVLDSLDPQIHGPRVHESRVPLSMNPEVDFVFGDVRDPHAWEQAFTGQSVIIHLAAQTGTGQSMYQTARYCDVNVHGTGVLLDFMLQHRASIRRVVVASSRAVYGEGSYVTSEGEVVYPAHRDERDIARGVFDPLYNHTPVTPCATTEAAPHQPTSVYGITKSTQELLVLNTCGAAQVSGIALRYQNVYGPGQSLSNPYTGILAIFSNLIRARQKIEVFEDGLPSRDFVYVDDVAEATIQAALGPLSGQHALNIGTGVPTTVLDVIHQLGKAYDCQPDYTVTGESRLGDIRHNWADTTSATDLLDWTASISFEQGVARLARWVESQATTKTDSYLQSLQALRQRGLMVDGRMND